MEKRELRLTRDGQDCVRNIIREKKQFNKALENYKNSDHKIKFQNGKKK